MGRNYDGLERQLILLCRLIVKAERMLAQATFGRRLCSLKMDQSVVNAGRYVKSVLAIVRSLGQIIRQMAALKRR